MQCEERTEERDRKIGDIVIVLVRSLASPAREKVGGGGDVTRDEEVDRVKGGGEHPHPSASWAEETII